LSESFGNVLVSPGGSITGTGILTAANFHLTSGIVSARLGAMALRSKRHARHAHALGREYLLRRHVLFGGTLAVGDNSAFGTSTLHFNSSTLTASGGARTLANPFVATNSSVLFVGADPLTFNGAGTLAGLVTLTVSGETTATLNGVIGESTQSILSKMGAGRLVVTGANTYTGGTSINAGTTSISNHEGSAFGTGAVSVLAVRPSPAAGNLPVRCRSAIDLPGNSPGTMSTGSQTWNGFASYDWELNKVAGPRARRPAASAGTG